MSVDKWRVFWANETTPLHDMLSEGGMVLHAGIPWSVARWSYYIGATRPNWHPRRIKNLASSTLRRSNDLKDKIGHWYDACWMCRLAEKHGLHCDIYGSQGYPYRFHLLLSRSGKTV